MGGGGVLGLAEELGASEGRSLIHGFSWLISYLVNLVR
jgi:hypothetical protein